MSGLTRVPLLRHCLTMQTSLDWMPRFSCLSLPDGRAGKRDYTNLCFKSIHFPLSTFYEHPLGNFNGIHTSLICHDFCLVLDVEMTWMNSTSAAVLQAQTQSDPICEFSWQKPWALLQSSLQIHSTILSVRFPSTCYF